MEIKDYSQNGEQLVIGKLLAGKTGRLLDIGAYRPDTFSNSRALLDAGWSGVLVEPSPAPFKALIDYYGGNPRVELVNCAITETSGLIQFYDSSGDAVSSTNIQHRDKWRANAGVNFKKTWVNTLAMQTLFGNFGVDFDFVNLDVENENFNMFRLIPISLMPTLKVVCVEHDGNHAAMLNAFQPYGFRQELLNAENIILVR